MRRVVAAFVLLVNFLKELLVSGWITAVIILRGGAMPRPGFVRIAHGELEGVAVNLLAALMTLTPGTTTVDIDLERREFLLHLLDADAAEATLAAIERDFLAPARILFGAKR